MKQVAPIIDKVQRKLLGQYGLPRYILDHSMELRRALYKRKYKEPIDEDIEFRNILENEPLLGYYLISNEIKNIHHKMNYLVNYIEKYPFVAIVSGAKGSGKTAWAGWLIDLVHKHLPDMEIYWYYGSHNLPDWVKLTYNLNDVPGDSMVIVDEAGIHFLSRDAMKRESKDISKILSVARHIGWRVIFISQTMRSVDVNIFNLTDIIIQKQAQRFMVMEEERGTKTLKTFIEMLMPKSKKDFLWFDGDELLSLTNDLPDWWSDKVSKYYKRLTKPEAVEFILKMYNSSVSVKQISEQLKIRGIIMDKEEVNAFVRSKPKQKEWLKA